MKSGWVSDIGIECHVQLKTKSKLFCGCSNDARQAPPNSLVCPVCLGLPGTLPVLNRRAVELAVQAGLALEAKIATHTKFDRKNYFYPDLPKGYQITQYDQPIVGAGTIEVPMRDGSSFSVRITRAHLEEDAGKLTHPEGADYSLVDLNRAGTPLLEIVSEPDIHSPVQAKAYVQELYQRMRYADVSEADLYHGNMRFDLNVSVRPEGSDDLGVRTEIKNLNSFRNVERAAAYEIERQIRALEAGEKIIQETRGWDESKTYAMRTKEEAADYRYFPEPDIPPLVISSQLREEIAASSPPHLNEIRRQLQAVELQSSQIDAILAEPEFVRMQLAVAIQAPEYSQTVAAWLSGELTRYLDTEEIAAADLVLDADRLIELAEMVQANELSSSAAKQVLLLLVRSQDDPRAIAEREQLVQVSDTDTLAAIVDAVIAEYTEAASDVRNGELRAIGFLVGQVMKQSQGQANPQVVQTLIRERLVVDE